MPLRPPAPCTQVGCGTLVRGGGRCKLHKAEAWAGRPVAKDRGYGRGHDRRFRPGVLRRDPVCRCDLTVCDHGDRPCPRASTVADHWPVDRRELVELELDADDPQYGRGLCSRCDKRQTARRQPGGFRKSASGAVS